MEDEQALLQAMDDLYDAEQLLINARDHYEQQEAREEVLTCSRIVNRLRNKVSE